MTSYEEEQTMKLLLMILSIYKSDIKLYIDSISL